MKYILPLLLIMLAASCSKNPELIDSEEPFSLLLSANQKANAELSLVVDLKSDSGHQLLVFHSVENNHNYAAVSSSNMQCVIDIANYEGPYGGVIFSWVGPDTLEILFPKELVITKKLDKRYKKCGESELYVTYKYID
ncbi:hypothetical protein [Flavobacterium sp. W21_SRS_FM6]|uniref:hypothetical protein n=1 Tax=Flavobacterium sp. W21_SRS_FM6 TaxID=3240268 RepID=UPI003F908415